MEACPRIGQSGGRDFARKFPEEIRERSTVVDGTRLVEGACLTVASDVPFAGAGCGLRAPYSHRSDGQVSGIRVCQFD